METPVVQNHYVVFGDGSIDALCMRGYAHERREQQEQNEQSLHAVGMDWNDPSKLLENSAHPQSSTK
jgi:hypothetical protein